MKKHRWRFGLSLELHYCSWEDLVCKTSAVVKFFQELSRNLNGTKVLPTLPTTSCSVCFFQ